MDMKTIAISACLLGESCRYDGVDNKNIALLKKLQGHRLISFCPEDHAFGTPRPAMDLVVQEGQIRAISNENGADLSAPVRAYAIDFFDRHTEIDLFIGKDRSPSCGVCSARLYDASKHLLSPCEAGFMAKEAQSRHIPCIDAENVKDIM